MHNDELTKEEVDCYAKKQYETESWLIHRDKWCLWYIGEAKVEQVRKRIRTHLVWKDKRTGSKLAEVQDAVGRGQRIAISFVEIRPESLRCCIEETLIKKWRPDWNNHHISRGRRCNHNPRCWRWTLC